METIDIASMSEGDVINFEENLSDEFVFVKENLKGKHFVSRFKETDFLNYGKIIELLKASGISLTDNLLNFKKGTITAAEYINRQSLNKCIQTMQERMNNMYETLKEMEDGLNDIKKVFTTNSEELNKFLAK